MPLVTEEQQEKKEASFLKYEAENILMILSNLYKIDSHYLKSANKFVSCHKEECFYCTQGIQKKTEYNYVVKLNGQETIMDIKPSVFFNINAIEKMSKKEKRYISWMVIKSGTGLDTEYTVSKDDNLDSEDIKKVDADLEKQNDKLAKLMQIREDRLEEEYQANLKEFTGKKIESVDPDDIEI